MAAGGFGMALISVTTGRPSGPGWMRWTPQSSAAVSVRPTATAVPSGTPATRGLELGSRVTVGPPAMGFARTAYPALGRSDQPATDDREVLRGVDAPALQRDLDRRGGQVGAGEDLDDGVVDAEQDHMVGGDLRAEVGLGAARSRSGPVPCACRP